MSRSPFRVAALWLLATLLLTLLLAALYVTLLRPAGLPFPWEV